MATKNGIDPAKGLGWGTFLAGFVPGLLQYQLGQKSKAGLAFLSCFALFFVGWLIVGERLFYWALFAADDKGGVANGLVRFGMMTLPEMMNLPANLIGSALAFDGTSSGLRNQRNPRDFEHIAAWVTGASGMLAAFWAAHGHWEFRVRRDQNHIAEGAKPVANPALCAGLSWLVPGMGHAKAGQKHKGVLLGIAVATVFALGLFFSGGHAVDRAQYSVWWIGQNLFGGGSLFASLVTGPMRTGATPIDLDLGIVLCTVAGLMNLVVMCDAYTVAERSLFPLGGKGTPAAGKDSRGSQGSATAAATEGTPSEGLTGEATA
ncbi:MAG: hypothetical protein ACI89X_001479 [Planctomycetota bacterium]|jgi:hypothetical protein